LRGGRSFRNPSDCRFGNCFGCRWIGESVSSLVPSATVGGDVVRARLAALHGAPIPTAAASVLVDITLGVFVQIVFTLLGLGLIVSATGQQGFVRPTLIGAGVIGVLAIVGFYIVQRLGVFRFIGTMISRLANAEDWHSMVHSGHTLEPRRFADSTRGVRCDWMPAQRRPTSLLVGSGEIWIALHALGLHATLVNAVILHSMVLAIRSAVFPVPGALGVQEAPTSSLVICLVFLVNAAFRALFDCEGARIDSRNPGPGCLADD